MKIAKAAEQEKVNDAFVAEIQLRIGEWLSIAPDLVTEVIDDILMDIGYRVDPR